MQLTHTQHGKEKVALKHLITYFASTVSHLPEVKLVKLIYIAQLYHYSNYGEFLTSTRFFCLSHGPHAPTIRSALQEQLERSTIFLEKSRTSEDPMYSNPVMIVRSCEPNDTKLPGSCLNTLRGVVNEWADKSFEDLLDYTTRTIPFLSATYREQIDLSLIQPFRGLERVLSLPRRLEIHHFVEAGGVVGESESCPVSINEVAEIYLALCGDLPDKIPFRENLGFNPQGVIDALSAVTDKDGAEAHRADIDKAAQFAESLLASMSFRSYSGRVALKAGMLFLHRSGYSFHGDVMEESWPRANDYRALREWFSKMGSRKG